MLVSLTQPLDEWNLLQNKSINEEDGHLKAKRKSPIFLFNTIEIGKLRGTMELFSGSFRIKTLKLAKYFQN